MTPTLPRVLGRPPARALLRVEPEDFQVREILGFAPEGSGQHRMLWVEKREVTTEQVARALGRLAGVPPVAVGYAGLKDRHALTWQWFSIDLAGRTEPDWTALELPGARVLAAHPHRRKLARGALQGNAFLVRLRAVSGDRGAVERRLQWLSREGFPNYFGEQRFGHESRNVERVRAWFAGRLRPRGRHERGLLLSSARSLLFNRVLAARVADGSWNRLLSGEAPMLDGRRALFRLHQPDAHSRARCRALDIHPTGPLWGRGETLVSGALGRWETWLCRRDTLLVEGLERAGVAAARRALRARAAELEWSWQGDSLELAFRLTAGTYATALLREVVEYASR